MAVKDVLTKEQIKRLPKLYEQEVPPKKVALSTNFGGAGSGNFDHAGRPGEVGGSGSGGESRSFSGLPDNWRQISGSTLRETPEGKKILTLAAKTARKENDPDYQPYRYNTHVGSKQVLSGFDQGSRNWFTVVKDREGNYGNYNYIGTLQDAQSSHLQEIGRQEDLVQEGKR